MRVGWARPVGVVRGRTLHHLSWRGACGCDAVLWGLSLHGQRGWGGLCGARTAGGSRSARRGPPPADDPPPTILAATAEVRKSRREKNPQPKSGLLLEHVHTTCSLMCNNYPCGLGIHTQVCLPFADGMTRRGPALGQRGVCPPPPPTTDPPANPRGWSSPPRWVHSACRERWVPRRGCGVCAGAHCWLS